MNLCSYRYLPYLYKEYLIYLILLDFANKQIYFVTQHTLVIFEYLMERIQFFKNNKLNCDIL